jgi:hypothetical protein
MKTPMQELIEVLKIHRDTAFEKEKIYPNNKEYYEGRAKAFEDAISFTEEHLKKEGEIIRNAFSDAQHGAVESRWTAEEYFEETFNTKER